eukprot:7239102-Pyramimonas_sp.AAC.1
MVHYLGPGVIEESATGVFQWISKVYQIILLDSSTELRDITKDAIHQKQRCIRSSRSRNHGADHSPAEGD